MKITYIDNMRRPIELEVERELARVGMRTEHGIDEAAAYVLEDGRLAIVRTVRRNNVPNVFGDVFTTTEVALLSMPRGLRSLLGPRLRREYARWLAARVESTIGGEA